MTKTATVHAQQRWEYMSLSRKTESYLARELNTFGQDGWELVTILYARGAKEEMFWTAFLKRPALGHVTPASTEGSAAVQHDPTPVAPTPTPTAPTPVAKKVEEKDPTEGLDGFNLDGDEFAIHEEPEEPDAFPTLEP